MSITKIYQSADGKIARVKQNQDSLTEEQELQLREALGGSFFEAKPEPKTTKKTKRKTNIYTANGRFTGADYKTGVDNNAFRIQFSNLDTNKERADFLRKKVGNDGYVIDKQGSFLLTPQGQQKLKDESIFGISAKGDNLLAIDKDTSIFRPSTWEGEDFADFLGAHGIETAAALATATPYAGPLSSARLIGKIAPKLAKNPSGFGYMLARNGIEGTAFALGKVADELQQKIRGVSRQSIMESAKDGAVEGALWWALPGFAFESLFKGAGLLLAGRKPKIKEGSLDVETNLAKEMKREADYGLKSNMLGPMGRNTAVLGTAIDFASVMVGQYAKNQKQNFDNIIGRMSQELGLDASKMPKDAVDNFRKSYTKYMKNEGDNLNLLREESQKNMKDSIQQNLNQFSDQLKSNKGFDDIGEAFEANKVLFYTNYGNANKALDVSNNQAVLGLQNIGKENPVLDITSGSVGATKASREVIESSNNLLNFLNKEKGISTSPSDQIITIKKPDELNLSKSDFIKKVIDENDDSRLYLIAGKDVAKNTNIKTIFPSLLSDELALQSLKGIKGVDAIPAFQKMIDTTDGVPPLSMKEYGDVLTAINDFNLQTAKGDVAVLKSGTTRLQNAAYLDLDNSVTKMAEDLAKYKDIQELYKKAKKPLPKEMDENINTLVRNLDQATILRQDFKTFKESTDTVKNLKIFDDISTDKIQPHVIFNAIEKDPSFVTDVVKAFENTADAKKLFGKTPIPKSLLDDKGVYSPSLLKQQQQEIYDKFVTEGVTNLDGERVFDEALARRLAKNISLTENFPQMMNSAGNAKNIRDRLAQVYLENMGNTADGLSLFSFKTKLDELFQPKPASLKTREGKTTTKDVKLADALFKNNKLLKDNLDDLRKTLNQLPKDALEELNLSPINNLDEALQAVPEGEINNVAQVVSDFNNAVKSQKDFFESASLKSIESGKITAANVSDILIQSPISQLRTMKNSNPLEFQSFKDLAFAGLVRETGQAKDPIISLMEPSKVLKNLENIGEDKFNLLFETGINKNPYSGVKDMLQALSRASEEPSIGGLAKIGLNYRILGNILPLGALGIGGGAAAAAGAPGLLAVGGGLAMMKLIAFAGTSKPLAKFLTRGVTETTESTGSLLSEYIKNREYANSLLLTSSNTLKPLAVTLIENTKEAEDAYNRAREIYGDELDYAGAVSALPSVQAVQERQREVNESLVNPLEEPLPSIQNAITRQQQISEGMPLPNVSPVGLISNVNNATRRALAGNNPNTQALVDRSR
jgi:hypothetical protein|tara:strand:+ start:1959 stop:5777 length:3819 start_codon:yes stop_codon:yes gene_type:complete